MPTMEPVAILHTSCGELHIYDVAGLREIMCALVVQLPVAQTPEAARDDEQNAKLDGFSLKEWSDYAKRKARIATEKCRENGKLKEAIRAHDPEAFVKGKGKVIGNIQSIMVDKVDEVPDVDILDGGENGSERKVAAELDGPAQDGGGGGPGYVKGGGLPNPTPGGR